MRYQKGIEVVPARLPLERVVDFGEREDGEKEKSHRRWVLGFGGVRWLAVARVICFGRGKKINLI